MSERIESLGYESHFIISNISEIFVIFTLVLLVLLILSIIIKFGSCLSNNSRILTLACRMSNYFYWNGAINCFNEAYLCLCFSICFNFTAFEFTSWELIFNSLFAAIVFLNIFMVPIIIAIVLNKYWCPYMEEANRFSSSPNIIEERYEKGEI